jgi:hypothetical protein
MAEQAFKVVTIARAALFAAAEKAIYLDMKLDGEKSAALLSGKIDGKNEEIRKAQLKDVLQDAFTELAISQNGERRARFDFDAAMTDLDTVKTFLRIAELAE